MVLLDQCPLLKTVEFRPRLSNQFVSFIAIHGSVGRIHISVQPIGIQKGETFHAVIYGTLELYQCLTLTFLLGDVDHDASESDWAPFIDKHADNVPNPDCSSIRRKHPVFKIMGHAHLRLLSTIRYGPLTVLGMYMIGPKRRIVEPLLNRIAEDTLGLNAHEGEA